MVSGEDAEGGGRRAEDGRQRTDDRGRRTEVRNLNIRKTWDIIEAAEQGNLPDKIMINVHPQRWTDRPLPWVKEMVWQNCKNLLKRGMIAWRRE